MAVLPVEDQLGGGGSYPPALVVLQGGLRDVLSVAQLKAKMQPEVTEKVYPQWHSNSNTR